METPNRRTTLSLRPGNVSNVQIAAHLSVVEPPRSLPKGPASCISYKYVGEIPPTKAFRQDLFFLMFFSSPAATTVIAKETKVMVRQCAV